MSAFPLMMLGILKYPPSNVRTDVSLVVLARLQLVLLNPNPESALNSEAAQLFKSNKLMYSEQVDARYVNV